MYRRIIYPGFLENKEVIIVTGSLYGAEISELCLALKRGIESEGHSVSICTLGQVREHCRADQFGSAGDWCLNYDVIIIDMGEYLGDDNFRHTKIPDVNVTRTLFLTPVAENDVAQTVFLPSEQQRQTEVQEYLEDNLPTPVHLVRPSLLRQTSSERLISETNNDILLALENNEEPNQELIKKRQEWKSTRVLDQIPNLKRRLW